MKQSARADLNHIRTFYWVAKSGSFTAAANILSLPKSTVSVDIRALEKRLGARLIERTTRRVALTEIGQLFFGYAERLIADVEEAEQAVTACSEQPRGLLRVGAPVTFARIFLAPVLPAFCRKYPEVKVELVIPGGRLDPVENRLDVSIRIGSVADSSYMVRKLGGMSQALFAAKEYLAKHAPPETPAALTHHTLIATGRTVRGVRWTLTDPAGEQEEIWFDPRLSVADPVIAHGMASSGLGIAMLPDFLTRDDSSLEPVLPAWRPPPVEFFALYPARRLTPLKLRVFLDEMDANLKL